MKSRVTILEDSEQVKREKCRIPARHTTGSTQRLKPNGMTETESKETLSPLGTEEFVEKIANLAWEKKALNLRALRVFELVNYTDWFVVMSARSDRQAAAITFLVNTGRSRRHKG